MVPWCHGYLVRWCDGVLVPWFHGALVPWFHGALVHGVHDGLAVKEPKHEYPAFQRHHHGNPPNLGSWLERLSIVGSRILDTRWAIAVIAKRVHLQPPLAVIFIDVDSHLGQLQVRGIREACFDDYPSAGLPMETLVGLCLRLNDKDSPLLGGEEELKAHQGLYTGAVHVGRWNSLLIQLGHMRVVPGVFPNSSIQNTPCHGALVPWFLGAIVPRCLGAMVPWFHGALVPWCHGAMVQRCFLAMVPWCHSATVPWALVPRCHGAMVPWCHGALVPWCHGARCHGALVRWCHGALVPWCLGVWCPWWFEAGARISNLTKTPPCSELVVQCAGMDPEGTIPSPSPSHHMETLSYRGGSSSSPLIADGFGTGTSMPRPQSQSFSPSYESILPTSLAYFVPSTKGCSSRRPDAVMSITEHRRHLIIRILKGGWECTRNHAMSGALQATRLYL
ncbi:hypothetical protein CQW23_32056 [Capsicum baccatum]|uniref:Uncharacterized protein n=1 Tax=Capsicum baccatum TaxID=33114 RepID=A0A2G2V5R8_CAPBA|nr:hypothetical protein CQW23_32056 [Capsicum baccatum]